MFTRMLANVTTSLLAGDLNLNDRATAFVEEVKSDLSRVPVVGKALLATLAFIWGQILLAGSARAEGTLTPQQGPDLITIVKKGFGVVILLIGAGSFVLGLSILVSAFLSFHKGSQGGMGGSSPWVKLVVGIALLGVLPLGYAFFRYLWGTPDMTITLPEDPSSIIQTQ